MRERTITVVANVSETTTYYGVKITVQVPEDLDITDRDVVAGFLDDIDGNWINSLQSAHTKEATRRFVENISALTVSWEGNG
ncbi:hypothetical protein [Actinoallomurus sp. NPDC052274]|uniref:hypothetical protein n=1 Tax=Actinoallomurus sp. NPDC052274 TaxID=3155420 RepID=UPI003443B3F9